MTPSDDVPFDLIHEPWLPVADLHGHFEERSISDTLGSAHQLAGLSGDVATQTFALTRMLLAILHGALAGPRDDDEWVQLWQAELLPAQMIASYLATHRERFDLVHQETPFLQVSGLRTAKGGSSELSKLVADVPNGIPFFTTRLGGDLSLSYAEAARWLVHCHAWDSSGIKSGATDDVRTRGGKGYPIGVAWTGLLGGVLLEGATLKETLLLNLMSRNFGAFARDPHVDRPAWERDPVTAAEEEPGGRRPTGPVDLYTWQSRRIRLFPVDGRVRSVLICNGERLTPQNMHHDEPHTAWRRSAPQERKLNRPQIYMPREHDPDRAIWRGLQSLLPAVSSGQKAEGAPALSPGILEWLGHLGLESMLPNDYPVRLRAVGMVYGSNNSVTDDIVDDVLSLRVLLARQDADELVGVATSCVTAAESSVKTLGNLAGDLAASAGGDESGPRSRVMEGAYADLDTPFRRWLTALRSDSDTIAVQIEWHATVRATVTAAADRLLTRVPPATWEGRIVRGRELTAAHADSRFRRDLRQSLPFAFPATTSV